MSHQTDVNRTAEQTNQNLIIAIIQQRLLLIKTKQIHLTTRQLVLFKHSELQVIINALKYETYDNYVNNIDTL